MTGYLREMKGMRDQTKNKDDNLPMAPAYVAQSCTVGEHKRVISLPTRVYFRYVRDDRPEAPKSLLKCIFTRSNVHGCATNCS